VLSFIEIGPPEVARHIRSNIHVTWQRCCTLFLLCSCATLLRLSCTASYDAVLGEEEPFHGLNAYRGFICPLRPPTFRHMSTGHYIAICMYSRACKLESAFTVTSYVLWSTYTGNHIQNIDLAWFSNCHMTESCPKRSFPLSVCKCISPEKRPICPNVWMDHLFKSATYNRQMTSFSIFHVIICFKSPSFRHYYIDYYERLEASTR
jgi:hypothetical protein